MKRLNRVLVKRADLPKNLGGAWGEDLYVCGLCALDFLNHQLIDPGVIYIEIHPLEEVDEKFADENNLYVVRESGDHKCGVILDERSEQCERKATVALTVWRPC